MLFVDLNVEVFDPSYTGSELRFVVHYEGREGHLLQRTGRLPNPFAQKADVLADSIALRTGEFARSRWRKLEVFSSSSSIGRWEPGVKLLSACRQGELSRSADLDLRGQAA